MNQWLKFDTMVVFGRVKASNRSDHAYGPQNLKKKKQMGLSIHPWYCSSAFLHHVCAPSVVRSQISI